ncbi:hypothetical protein DAI22_04g237350 [Oryza sativa Japonica Group]|nr:hypothetical protein DAI22_04g237350 [Oryza sativa Japonica Group]
MALLPFILQVLKNLNAYGLVSQTRIVWVASDCLPRIRNGARDILWFRAPTTRRRPAVRPAQRNKLVGRPPREQGTAAPSPTRGIAVDGEFPALVCRSTLPSPPAALGGHARPPPHRSCAPLPRCFLAAALFPYRSYRIRINMRMCYCLYLTRGLLLGPLVGL